MIYEESLSALIFVHSRPKKYVSWAFDWTVLFYKLVYKTKRSTVIGLIISSESTPYYDTELIVVASELAKCSRKRVVNM